MERLTFGLALLWVAADSSTQLGLPVAVPTAVLALSLALVQGLRLAGWHDRRVWGIPLLAVLYSGYLWLILGLTLNGLAHLGLLQPFPALHALTIGAIGIFTLGMMARALSIPARASERGAARWAQWWRNAHQAAFAETSLHSYPDQWTYPATVGR